MSEFEKYDATTHPVITKVGDYNNIIKHAFERGASFIARKNGANYELIYGHAENQAGKIVTAATDTDALTLLNWLKNNAAENCLTLFVAGDYTVSAKFSTTKKLRFHGEGSGTRILPGGSFDALDPTNLSLLNIVWRDADGVDHDASFDPNLFEDALRKVTVGGGGGYVSITMDDANDEQYDFAYPIFEALGIPFCLCINTDDVGQAGKLTWAEINTMLAGMGGLLEISSHSKTHPSALPLAESEFTASKQAIIDNTGFTPRTFTFPGGRCDYQEQVYLFENYEAGLGTIGYVGLGTKVTLSSPAYLNHFPAEKGYLNRVDILNNIYHTMNDWESYLYHMTKVLNAWHIILIHTPTTAIIQRVVRDLLKSNLTIINPIDMLTTMDNLKSALPVWSDVTIPKVHQGAIGVDSYVWIWYDALYKIYKTFDQFTLTTNKKETWLKIWNSGSQYYKAPPPNGGADVDISPKSLNDLGGSDGFFKNLLYDDANDYYVIGLEPHVLGRYVWEPHQAFAIFDGSGAGCNYNLRYRMRILL